MGTMGIEPMTNGLLDQRSTDWAMRPDKYWSAALFGWKKLKKCKLVGLTRLRSFYFGFDHINRNAPVLIRTPKLTRFEPAQYWGGGPPGNSVVLNPFFTIFLYYKKLFCWKWSWEPKFTLFQEQIVSVTFWICTENDKKQWLSKNNPFFEQLEYMSTNKF